VTRWIDKVAVPFIPYFNLPAIIKGVALMRRMVKAA
jgi:hypothetical protein